MSEFFDTKKSFIISSPAGSGKTEKLARRYISLIAAGSEVERVLAITFTEKAASEMKQRILNILSLENPELYFKVKPRVPLMRISTIHAFCLKLLRRFSLDLGLDPRLSVADEGVSSALMRESIMDALKEEAGSLGQDECRPGKKAPFFELMKERGVRGWESVLKNHLAELFRQRPLSELFIEETVYLREGRRGEKEKMLLELFARCLDTYRAKKLEARLLDFSDLEVLAYKALAKSPHWQNILYSFDEYTDHILVDEFQDTSALQWRILDKLTEEWRSGIGPKREAGTVPTFFLVGDEKQSIYLFRGADVSAMKKARQRLQDFLGTEYEFHQAKDNYRSLPAIIDFTNRLFEKLMPRAALLPGAEPAGHDVKPDAPYEFDLDQCRVEYCSFEAKRQGDGKVELLLLDLPKTGFYTKEKRDFEARTLAKRIKAMRRNYQVTDKSPRGKRPCEYADMAVLLRQRTHLAAFEEAFRREGVPFLVVKGMGFYEEPEVALLREFATFIADPQNDYSLFCLLRSPLFGFSYKTLSRLHSKNKNIPLIESLRAATGKKNKKTETAALLDDLITKGKALPLSKLIEYMLVKTGGWKHFWERPRHANVKKFIQMVESYESRGQNIIEIRDKLLADRTRTEVSKANVNAEGIDVVKLMTVHAAKGLQFPMLFLPSLDEDISAKSTPVAIEERASGSFGFRYEPDADARKNMPEFERGRIKELEEEKRLFYVAATRAMDYLLLSGIKSGKPKGRLKYLIDAFGEDFCLLEPENADTGEKTGDALPLQIENAPLSFSVITAEDVERNYEKSVGMELTPETHFLDEPVYAEPFEYEPQVSTKDVTEDILVKTRHGRDWVLLGKLMHQVLEDISGGKLDAGDVRPRILSQLKGFYIFEPQRQKLFLETILGDIQKMRDAGILENIVLPRKKSFTELPFVHEKGKTLYKGRIDRLIVENGEVRVYDYKSFPVRPRELEELSEKYRFQMELYKEAAEGIFGLPAKAFLVFTHIPLVMGLSGDQPGTVQESKS